MSKAIAVTFATFDAEVLQSELPVLVDVWATWCPPCRRLMPVIDAIATKYAGRLKVVKCDFDHNPEVAGKYNIMSIPNLLFLKGGQLVAQHAGFLSESQLAAKVDELLGH